MEKRSQFKIMMTSEQLGMVREHEMINKEEKHSLSCGRQIL